MIQAVNKNRRMLMKLEEKKKHLWDKVQGQKMKQQRKERTETG